MSNKVEIGIIALVFLLAIVYNVFVHIGLFEISGRHYLLDIAYLSQILLPAYYYYKSNSSLNKIVLVYFLLFPIGNIFYENHFPLGAFLLVFGLMGYLSTALYLIIKTDRLSLSHKEVSVAIIFLSVLIFVPLYVFSLDYRFLLENGIYKYSSLILLFCSSFFIFETGSKVVQINALPQMGLIKIVGANAILPVSVMAIDLIMDRL